MKKLNNLLSFNNYQNNYLNENLQTIFKYTKKFGNILEIIQKQCKEIGICDKISEELLKSYNKLNTNYTSIDITKDYNIVSYINVLRNNNRKNVKLGKLINKIFPDKFTNIEIDNFIKLYKYVFEMNKFFFKKVNGNEIKKWYNEENTNLSGNLGKSCMKYSRCGDYLDIYINNPDKVQLLLLFKKEEKEKILGRSLLWISNDTTYIDNIYVSETEYEYIFENYIRNHNIKKIVSPIYINLKPKKYNFYPYLDTLDIYQPSTGIITNDIKYVKNNNGDIMILDGVYGFGRKI
jgi:hypothetical protein